MEVPRHRYARVLLGRRGEVVVVAVDGVADDKHRRGEGAAARARGCGGRGAWAALGKLKERNALSFFAAVVCLEPGTPLTDGESRDGNK